MKKDFITKEEERSLIEIAKDVEEHNIQFKEYTANRKTASFRYNYSFETRKLTKGKDIPAAMFELQDGEVGQLGALMQGIHFYDEPGMCAYIR